MMVTPSVKLVRQLGEGGMGSVWVAEHLALRTQVVVKFIASGLTSNKEAQDRFSREAAAAAQVKSPHVVQTFDHGISDDGVPYIVMELLEGRDLGEYLDRENKVPPELVVEILVQLSRALDRAHEKGIIHRDIKPGNIYLCDAGRSGEVFVKLLDFGIAKGMEMPKPDSGTKTGSMIGSPFYMSPEQILGSKGVDHRSDLWSVGVVAFEMLTGRKPFDAETMGGLAIKIHSEPLPLATTVNPDLPIAVDAWFARALARDVNARFATAKEMTEELARALGGEMPKSLDMAPRISTNGSRRKVNPVAPTLAAGAATDAGVVRDTQNKSRSRFLVLIAIVLIVGPITYVGFRAILKKDATPTALVPPDPSVASSAKAAPSGTSTGATAALTSTSASSTTTSTGTPPTTTEIAAVASGPANPGIRPHGNGTRPRPTSSTTSVPTSTSTSTSTATSTLTSPPVTSTTTPRPATSGHDIF
jgi:serine/threonine-protein kinase